MTHTVATLEVSEQCFDEISIALREAGYGHVFSEDARGLQMDMTGIALIRAASRRKTAVLAELLHAPAALAGSDIRADASDIGHSTERATWMNEMYSQYARHALATKKRLDDEGVPPINAKRVFRGMEDWQVLKCKRYAFTHFFGLLIE